MTEALQDIYRERVLDHSRHPHNQRQPADANRTVTGFNPLCGDKLTVYLTVADGKVVDAAFDGVGCAISVASASMMTDALLGAEEQEALNMVAAIHDMFAAGNAPENTRLEETTALAGVRDYPSRVKCATLAWSAVEAALRDATSTVSTE